MMSSFNTDWHVRRDSDGSERDVTLPHDAMMWEGRSAYAPSGSHEAFFLGGTYRYARTWFAPPDLAGKVVSLVFEAIYRHAKVYLNGREIGRVVSGYTEFEVRLDLALTLGGHNLIEVVVENAALPNARWYTGSGIYRPVWLRVVDRVHVEHQGVRYHTLSIGDVARVSFTVDLAKPEDEPVEVGVVLDYDGVAAAQASVQGTASTHVMLEVPVPRLWSAESPSLYDCTVQVRAGGVVRDERTLKVGLRTIAVDGRDGLRVNGQPTLLRGANVHHDNGVLGAATFRDAEFRRIRILKETGFNAVRSAHNPASRDLLDACDALGMYVMDELFDHWYDRKTDHDDAPCFGEIWRNDTDAMVRRDRAHCSVIMYSVGNENSEPVSAYGIETARRLVERVRALDPNRPVTAGVNLMSAALGWPATRKGGTTEQPETKIAPNMNSTMVNAVTNQFTRLMKWVPRLKRTDAVTRDLFALLDVAGYNYGSVRYVRDAALHPDRAIVGTETVPGDIVETWALVERVSNVIGDFTWAGWDYLGEAGIGTWEYGKVRARLLKPYPQIIAGCGAIDLIGVPGAPALLAQAAWGLLEKPAITVRPLDVAGKKARRTAWRSTDAVASLAWKGCAGRKAEIEVVSCDDEVEVVVNGKSLGRRPAGLANGHVARFDGVYAPGEMIAIGYRSGVETGRSTLRSAGAVSLRLVAERETLQANEQDLAFLRVELADAHGVIEMLDDDQVDICIDGPATLAGFGSAAPATEERYDDATHRTYQGRALAVIRAGSVAGSVEVTATSDRHGTATVRLVQRRVSQ
uniref:glycoside hydrolase family 2 TIM barrel-domain containing protein n=1 Tax=uncultured Sphingomonas sp. TaxID=158754 RepID=UPI0035C98091